MKAYQGILNSENILRFTSTHQMSTRVCVCVCVNIPAALGLTEQLLVIYWLLNCRLVCVVLVNESLCVCVCLVACGCLLAQMSLGKSTHSLWLLFFSSAHKNTVSCRVCLFSIWPSVSFNEWLNSDKTSENM